MRYNVFIIPKNHEYIKRLAESLKAEDVGVIVLKPFHYSTFMNVAKLLFFRMQGYRIIHVHWLYIFPFGFVMKWFYYFCRVLNIKVVWEVHNILPHNYNERDKRHSRWFYEKSDAIIFHSENDIARAKELLQTLKSKMHVVVPHGNFNGSYASELSKEEARKALNIPPGKRVILCFGFIRKNRGYEYLFEATRAMHDTVVIVAGKILERDAYKKLLAYEKQTENLRLFAEWVPDEQLQVYFKASDIVVLPYTEITTSGVIPLAYALEKPVVTSDIGGLKDVVNERTGILVPPRDVVSLRMAIEKLFSMDIEAMGRYAREYAGRTFNWQSNTKKIKELYGQVLNAQE